ncbi:MAG: winged helix-turn-helix domain-containing protein [Candidatus Tectomicrobia bacterium]|uniref:Winged helix-turn-helix domain-containing protein n=1 Tax=Tectimicrobiota bacterium TaxID=2528274 RepID=A0A938B4F1_UNCTE|nr:winged helix-turn-helix domain-containing protein [Candidatus Tectomicrobia bacterium]
MQLQTLSMTTARRFILGKQGLWPGRRWQGQAGIEAAMRAVEHLQLDPLVVVARSHDLMLHSRVSGYTPDAWTIPAYQERKFFDWGGWLAVRPMDELPYWRALMRRERQAPAWRQFAQEHATVIDEMRVVLRAREVVKNRDFAMHTRTRVDSYRGRKDSALALHYLWRTGEAMTHHRERFERVYALAERVAPEAFLTEASDSATDHFLLTKQLAFYGLSPLTRPGDWLKGPLRTQAMQQRRATMLREGEMVAVAVEGWPTPGYVLAADISLLDLLQAGEIPSAWQPHGATTTEEVTLLAPLDPVSARGRARQVFGFDYVWEVYKPAAQRLWGYYTLPVLWGDRLVARIDPKFERATQTLVVCGWWLEEAATGQNARFAEALARGLTRLMDFLGATTLAAQQLTPPRLRQRVVGLVPWR